MGDRRCRNEWRQRLFVEDRQFESCLFANPLKYDNLAAAKQKVGFVEQLAELKAVNAKIKAILPDGYRDCYESILPESMGSAKLAYGPDGRIDWDSMWTHFCDLALAGGPAHRGTLLEPCSSPEMASEEENYRAVVAEIGRGIGLVANLPVILRHLPGWVAVRCTNKGMAAWLLRAIMAENIMTRHDGELLLLPAGPSFRQEKEIKNVITSVAKTCHYWNDHTSDQEQESIAAAIDGGLAGSELLEPAIADEIRTHPSEYETVIEQTERGIAKATGLETTRSRASGWIGVPTQNERMAIWMMRVLIVDNILARREGAMLCVPVCPSFSVNDRVARLVDSVGRAFRLWELQQAMKLQPGLS